MNDQTPMPYQIPQVAFEKWEVAIRRARHRRAGLTHDLVAAVPSDQQGPAMLHVLDLEDNTSTLVMVLQQIWIDSLADAFESGRRHEVHATMAAMTGEPSPTALLDAPDASEDDAPVKTH